MKFSQLSGWSTVSALCNVSLGGYDSVPSLTRDLAELMEMMQSACFCNKYIMVVSLDYQQIYIKSLFTMNKDYGSGTND